MRNFIKNVTLRLSQGEANYLKNGVNAKYFMDIMSELHVCFKYDEETNEPDLIYAPTAFFNLNELAARWNIASECVIAVVLDLKENGLLHFTLTDDELSIEPEIATFVSGDNLTYRGTALGVDYLDYDFEKMDEVDKKQIMSRLAGLVCIDFSSEQLETGALTVKA